MAAAAARQQYQNGAGGVGEARNDPRGVRRAAKGVTFTTTSSCSSKDDHHDVGQGRQESGVYGEGHSASGGYTDRDNAASGEGYSSSALLATDNRSITPPHIAHGRGTKAGYEKYLII